MARTRGLARAGEAGDAADGPRGPDGVADVLRRGARDVAFMLVSLGGLAVAPLGLAMAEADDAATGFALVVAAGIGGLAVLGTTRTDTERSGHEALTAVAVGWLVCGALAALPFLVAAHLAPEPSATLIAFRRPVNALFEAMSGITGTGLSVASDPSALPASLLLWRSLTEWAGAIGWMIVGLLLVHRADGRSAYRRHARQLNAELSLDDVSARSDNPILTVAGVYLAYTALSVLAFLAVGLPAWESLNHGLTGISTGGFAVTSDSFRGYDAPVLAAATVIMLAGAVSFSVHYALVCRRMLNGEEARQLVWYGGFVTAGIALIAVLAWGAETGGTEARFVANAFNWVSGATTTGFMAQDIDGWSAAALLALSFAIFVGGCTGSTAGGLKVRRLATIVEGLRLRITDAGRDGDEDESADEGGRDVRRLHDAAARLCFLAFAVALGLVAILAFMETEAPMEHVLFDAVSALSTSGLSTGFVQPDLPAPVLLVFTGLMWLGRLEVLAALVAVLAFLRAPAMLRRLRR